MPDPRAMRYTRAVRNGTKIRKMIHTAFQPPPRVWSRNRSPRIENSTIRYAMKTKTQKNQATKLQKSICIANRQGRGPNAHLYEKLRAARYADVTRAG